MFILPDPFYSKHDVRFSRACSAELLLACPLDAASLSGVKSAQGAGSLPVLPTYALPAALLMPQNWRFFPVQHG